MNTEKLSSVRAKNLRSSIDWSVLLFGAALIQFVFFTWLTLDQPTLDMWGFRPAQTAVSVPYILRDGAWLANIVPIFGEPWVWPLEFPLYQWCVAALTWMTGLSIDACGRLVSAFFAVAIIWPAILLSRVLKLPQRFAFVLSGLWLFAPVTVFWGRTFLMETTIVFFAASWLVFYIRFLIDRSWVDFIASTVFGVIAALVKITGFAPFVVVGFISTCIFVWRHRSSRMSDMIVLALAGGSMALAVGLFFVWSGYADRFMQQNPLLAQLRSQNLVSWYFGSWEDRFSHTLWDWTVRLRALPEALGAGWIILAYGFIRVGPETRWFWIGTAALAGYISAFGFFPKLHMNHPYYQVENTILICGFAALIAETLIRSNKRIEGWAIVILLAVGQLWTFYSGYYYAAIRSDLHRHPYYLAAQAVRNATPMDSVVVGFGMGYGADIPYIADRRGIILANWFAVPAIRDVLFERREKWFGGRKLGAVVDCRVFDNQAIAPALEPIRDELKRELSGRPLHLVGAVHGATANPAQCDVFLPPE